MKIEVTDIITPQLRQWVEDNISKNDLPDDWEEVVCKAVKKAVQRVVDEEAQKIALRVLTRQR